MTTIYDLTLNQHLIVENEFTKEKEAIITRVPGGWIYTLYHKTQPDATAFDRLYTSVFVPYDDEFKNADLNID